MSKIKNTVRVVKRKYGTWGLHYINPNGKRRRLSVGYDYQHAQKLAVKFSDWLLEGKNPETEIERLNKTEISKEISLKEFFKMFMERHGSNQSKKMQEMYKDRFKQICRCPDLSDVPIGNITKRLMIDYMHARMKQDNVSAATVNREASIIKSMLFRAVEWDIIDKNSLQGLKLLPEAEKRQVDITPEQVGEIISKLQEPISSIVELAIYTGFRKENILDLRIESISFHDLTSTGEVELTVKGGRKEIFPLSESAVEVLKRNIGDRKEGHVFLNPDTAKRFRTINKGFDNAVRELGLTVNGTKLRFHDLRHVFATWLHKAGVSLDVVRPLLGHQNRETTDRYVTYNRLSYCNVLNAIPKINRNTKKETPKTLKSKSLLIKNSTNWHARSMEHLSFVPRKAVSN